MGGWDQNGARKISSVIFFGGGGGGCVKTHIFTINTFPISVGYYLSLIFKILLFWNGFLFCLLGVEQFCIDLQLKPEEFKVLGKWNKDKNLQR